MFPQNERDKVMYVKLSRLFLHGSYMCQQSSAWSATKSFVQLINHGGGGALTLKVPHGWLDSYYRARGLSRVFSKMRGSFSEKTKKRNSENSTNFCQFSSQNTILGSLFYDKINWKFWWNVKTGGYLMRDCWKMVLNYTKWGQWVNKSDQSSLSSIFSRWQTPSANWNTHPHM